LHRKLYVVLVQILQIQKPVRAFARIRPQQYLDAGFTLSPSAPTILFAPPLLLEINYYSLYYAECVNMTSFTKITGFSTYKYCIRRHGNHLLWLQVTKLCCTVYRYIIQCGLLVSWHNMLRCSVNAVSAAYV